LTFENPPSNWGICIDNISPKEAPTENLNEHLEVRTLVKKATLKYVVFLHLFLVEFLCIVFSLSKHKYECGVYYNHPSMFHQPSMIILFRILNEFDLKEK
jgi:hypothetical protein